MATAYEGGPTDQGATMIDMKGVDWAKGPSGGIYLMGHDTSEAQVRRGGGGMLGSAKLRGWDGGKFIPGDVKTSAEALRLTGLDWMVERRPIIQVDPVIGVGEKGPEVIGWEPRKSDDPVDRGARRQVNDLPTGGYAIAAAHVMNVRADTGQVLGVVGPGWRSPQNDEAFAFMDELVDSNEARWLGGGMIDGGRRVWMVAQLDRQVALGGEESELSVPLAFIANGWDGTLALSITAAPYRLACVNGQTIPLEGFVRTWKARHSSGLGKAERLQEARRTLELSIGYFDAWSAAMEKLMTQKVTPARVEKLVTLLLPDPPPGKGKEVAGDRALRNVDAKREAVLTIYKHAEDLQHLGHTKYRVLNAVTEYADWHVKVPLDRQVLRSAEPSKLKDKAYGLLVHA